MLIERPPLIYRMLFPGALFRVPTDNRCVYLTFDDGPIPEVTPWVLDVLDKYDVKATFFVVGDNVRKHPEVFAEVKRRGHLVGNHTMNHLQGIKVSSDDYIENVKKADAYVGSTLFRPPHGIMKMKQLKELRQNFTIVMHDLVTRDYSRHMTAEDVVNNVKKYARPGSIIVFHDSLKSEMRLKEALPKSIEWLIKEGYTFQTLEAFEKVKIEK